MTQEYRFDVGSRSFRAYVGSGDPMILRVRAVSSFENVLHWELAARAGSIEPFFRLVEDRQTEIHIVLTAPFQMAPLWSADYAFRQLEGGSPSKLASEVLHHDVPRYEFSIHHQIAEIDVMSMVEIGLVCECRTMTGAVYDFADGLTAEEAESALRAAKALVGSGLDPGNVRIKPNNGGYVLTERAPHGWDYAKSVHAIRSKICVESE